jgi:hypothetical protein
MQIIKSCMAEVTELRGQEDKVHALDASIRTVEQDTQKLKADITTFEARCDHTIDASGRAFAAVQAGCNETWSSIGQPGLHHQLTTVKGWQR